MDNTALQRDAAYALGYCGGRAVDAVPDLIPLLTASEVGNRPTHRIAIRSITAITLGKIGLPASDALPDLRSMMMNDPDINNGTTAAIAVWRISGDVTNTLPLLMKGLTDSAHRSKWHLIEALKEMGPQAKDAVPIMLDILSTPAPLVRGRPDPKLVSVQRMIPEALAIIDPATAERIEKQTPSLE